jgi:hypothetical protein
MTHLHRHRGFVQTAGLLIAIGCSSRVEVAQQNTGGAHFAGGATTSGGVTSVGGVSNTGDTGGSGHTLGGSLATGGVQDAGATTGGGPFGNGGTQGPTGGRTGTGGAPPGGHTGGWVASGGEDWGPGGAPWVATGGWKQTGGAPWVATGGAGEQGGTVATGGAMDVTGGNTAVTGVCTPGADHTCNDDPTVSALMGHCNSDGSCACGDGYVFKHSSGKCLPYEQTVCYSPTQNIDLAYVDRAFGCHCDPNTAIPFCGIDSQGLRVYLDCQAFDQSWHSASTTYCNGSNPVPCFSPTRNPETALTPNALGCSCFVTGLQECVTLASDLDAGSSGVLDLDAGSSMSVELLCSAAGRWEGLYAGCQ